MKVAEMILKMDAAMILNTTDREYDEWLEIIGDFYRAEMTGKEFFRNRIKNGEIDWLAMKTFFNAHNK